MPHRLKFADGSLEDLRCGVKGNMIRGSGSRYRLSLPHCRSSPWWCGWPISLSKKSSRRTPPAVLTGACGLGYGVYRHFWLTTRPSIPQAPDDFV